MQGIREDFSIESKQCSKCSIIKPIERFDFSYDKRCLNPGRRADCKDCRNAALKRRYHKNPQKLRDRSKKHRKENPEYYRNFYLLRSFGISAETYKGMLKDQDNCCAICGVNQKNLTKRLAVDHCHTTGKVRQLLCTMCNSALGHAKDSPSILLKCAEYLIKHSK